MVSILIFFYYQCIKHIIIFWVSVYISVKKDIMQF
jgi:hypothetical protein